MIFKITSVVVAIGMFDMFMRITWPYRYKL